MKSLLYTRKPEGDYTVIVSKNTKRYLALMRPDKDADILLAQLNADGFTPKAQYSGVSIELASKIIDLSKHLYKGKLTINTLTELVNAALEKKKNLHCVEQSCETPVEY